MSASEELFQRYVREFSARSKGMNAGEYQDLGAVQREAYRYVAKQRGWKLVEPVEVPFNVKPSPYVWPNFRPREDGASEPKHAEPEAAGVVSTSIAKGTPARPVFRSIRGSRVSIIGQDHAMDGIDDLLESACLGLLGGQGKPLATMLIAGPSGVGKTETAKAIAEVLYGSVDRLVRMNMNEHVGETAIWHAFGAVRGYKNADEGGVLINQVVKYQGRCVILLDECEKGGQEFLRAMMTALDEGYFENRRTGERVSLENAVIVMTTNAMADVRGIHDMSDSDIRKGLLGKVIGGQQLFLPEFIGRIQKVIGYRSLERVHLAEILQMRYLRESVPRIQNSLGIQVIGMNDEAALLVAGSLIDSPFGVRDLDNMMYQHLVRPIKGCIDQLDPSVAWEWRATADDQLSLFPVSEEDLA